MSKRKKPPREQLIEAGKIARDMLVERKILAKDSIIDRILKDRTSPPLPGVPAYLPYMWTIQGAQRIMRDIMVLWIAEPKNQDNDSRANDFALFVSFAHEELYTLIQKYNEEIVSMPAVLKSLEKAPIIKDVFAPLRKKQNARVMHRFLIDSFAIAVLVKHHHTVEEYLEWFGEWTNKLKEFWPQDKNK